MAGPKPERVAARPTGREVFRDGLLRLKRGAGFGGRGCGGAGGRSGGFPPEGGGDEVCEDDMGGEGED